MEKPNLPNFDILRLSSKHFEERHTDVKSRNIYGIIVHCVGLPLQEIFRVFDELKVSTHYLIPQITGLELKALMPEEFGAQTLLFPDSIPVIQLVNDLNIAYHAGVSCFANKENLNTCTIGIEFHSPGYGDDNRNLYQFTHYTEGQRITGINLISYLIDKYDFPSTNILGHSTVSVGRKTDPGPQFFWKFLHESGIGYMPTPKPKSSRAYLPEANLGRGLIKWIQKRLLEIGFSTCPQTGELDEFTQRHIDAYIMQFSPELWNGKNTSPTLALAESLNGFDACIFRYS